MSPLSAVGRQRDLLPLPFLDNLDGCSKGKSAYLSRGCRQRGARRDAVNDRTNAAVATLNDLYCNGGKAVGPSSEGQSSVLQEMRATVASTGAPPADLHEHEALCALLREDAQYSEDGGGSVGSLATFGSAAVSVPVSARSSPPAASLLPEEKASVLEGFREHM